MVGITALWGGVSTTGNGGGRDGRSGGGDGGGGLEVSEDGAAKRSNRSLWYFCEHIKKDIWIRAR